MSRKPTGLQPLTTKTVTMEEHRAAKAARDAKLTTLHIELPASLHAAVKKRAIDKGLKLRELVIQALELQIEE